MRRPRWLLFVIVCITLIVMSNFEVIEAQSSSILQQPPISLPQIPSQTAATCNVINTEKVVNDVCQCKHPVGELPWSGRGCDWKIQSVVPLGLENVDFRLPLDTLPDGTWVRVTFDEMPEVTNQQFTFSIDLYDSVALPGGFGRYHPASGYTQLPEADNWMKRLHHPFNDEVVRDRNFRQTSTPMENTIYLFIPSWSALVSEDPSFATSDGTMVLLVHTDDIESSHQGLVGENGRYETIFQFQSTPLGSYYQNSLRLSQTQIPNCGEFGSLIINQSNPFGLQCKCPTAKTGEFYFEACNKKFTLESPNRHKLLDNTKIPFNFARTNRGSGESTSYLSRDFFTDQEWASMIDKNTGELQYLSITMACADPFSGLFPGPELFSLEYSYNANYDVLRDYLDIKTLGVRMPQVWTTLKAEITLKLSSPSDHLYPGIEHPISYQVHTLEILNSCHFGRVSPSFVHHLDNGSDLPAGLLQCSTTGTEICRPSPNQNDATSGINFIVDCVCKDGYYGLRCDMKVDYVLISQPSTGAAPVPGAKIDRIWTPLYIGDEVDIAIDQIVHFRVQYEDEISWYFNHPTMSFAADLTHPYLDPTFDLDTMPFPSVYARNRLFLKNRMRSVRDDFYGWGQWYEEDPIFPSMVKLDNSNSEYFIIDFGVVSFAGKTPLTSEKYQYDVHFNGWSQPAFQDNHSNVPANIRFNRPAPETCTALYNGPNAVFCNGARVYCRTNLLGDDCSDTVIKQYEFLPGTEPVLHTSSVGPHGLEWRRNSADYITADAGAQIQVFARTVGGHLDQIVEGFIDYLFTTSTDQLKFEHLFASSFANMVDFKYDVWELYIKKKSEIYWHNFGIISAQDCYDQHENNLPVSHTPNLLGCVLPNTKVCDARPVFMGLGMGYDGERCKCRNSLDVNWGGNDGTNNVSDGSAPPTSWSFFGERCQFKLSVQFSTQTNAHMLHIVSYTDDDALGAVEMVENTDVKIDDWSFTTNQDWSTTTKPNHISILKFGSVTYTLTNPIKIDPNHLHIQRFYIFTKDELKSPCPRNSSYQIDPNPADPKLPFKCTCDPHFFGPVCQFYLRAIDTAQVYPDYQPDGKVLVLAFGDTTQSTSVPNGAIPTVFWYDRVNLIQYGASVWKNWDWDGDTISKFDSKEMLFFELGVPTQVQNRAQSTTLSVAVEYNDVIYSAILPTANDLSLPGACKDVVDATDGTVCEFDSAGNEWVLAWACNPGYFTLYTDDLPCRNKVEGYVYRLRPVRAATYTYTNGGVPVLEWWPNYIHGNIASLDIQQSPTPTTSPFGFQTSTVTGGIGHWKAYLEGHYGSQPAEVVYSTWELDEVPPNTEESFQSFGLRDLFNSDAYLALDEDEGFFLTFVIDDDDENPIISFSFENSQWLRKGIGIPSDCFSSSFSYTPMLTYPWMGISCTCASYTTIFDTTEVSIGGSFGPRCEYSYYFQNLNANRYFLDQEISLVVKQTPPSNSAELANGSTRQVNSFKTDCDIRSTRYSSPPHVDYFVFIHRLEENLQNLKLQVTPTGSSTPYAIDLTIPGVGSSQDLSQCNAVGTKWSKNISGNNLCSCRKGFTGSTCNTSLPSSLIYEQKYVDPTSLKRMWTYHDPTHSNQVFYGQWLLVDDGSNLDAQPNLAMYCVDTDFSLNRPPSLPTRPAKHSWFNIPSKVSSIDVSTYSFNNGAAAYYGAMKPGTLSTNSNLENRNFYPSVTPFTPTPSPSAGSTSDPFTIVDACTWMTAHIDLNIDPTLSRLGRCSNLPSHTKECNITPGATIATCRCNSYTHANGDFFMAFGTFCQYGMTIPNKPYHGGQKISFTLVIDSDYLHWPIDLHNTPEYKKLQWSEPLRSGFPEYGFTFEAPFRLALTAFRSDLTPYFIMDPLTSASSTSSNNTFSDHTNDVFETQTQYEWERPYDYSDKSNLDIDIQYLIPTIDWNTRTFTLPDMSLQNYYYGDILDAEFYWSIVQTSIRESDGAHITTKINQIKHVPVSYIPSCLHMQRINPVGMCNMAGTSTCFDPDMQQWFCKCKLVEDPILDNTYSMGPSSVFIPGNNQCYYVNIGLTSPQGHHFTHPTEVYNPDIITIHPDIPIKWGSTMDLTLQPSPRIASQDPFYLGLSTSSPITLSVALKLTPWEIPDERTDLVTVTMNIRPIFSNDPGGYVITDWGSVTESFVVAPVTTMPNDPSLFSTHPVAQFGLLSPDPIRQGDQYWDFSRSDWDIDFHITTDWGTKTTHYPWKDKRAKLDQAPLFFTNYQRSAFFFIMDGQSASNITEDRGSCRGRGCGKDKFVARKNTVSKNKSSSAPSPFNPQYQLHHDQDFLLEVNQAWVTLGYKDLYPSSIVSSRQCPYGSIQNDPDTQDVEHCYCLNPWMSGLDCNVYMNPHLVPSIELFEIASVTPTAQDQDSKQSEFAPLMEVINNFAQRPLSSFQYQRTTGISLTPAILAPTGPILPSPFSSVDGIPVDSSGQGVWPKVSLPSWPGIGNEFQFILSQQTGSSGWSLRTSSTHSAFQGENRITSEIVSVQPQLNFPSALGCSVQGTDYFDGFKKFDRYAGHLGGNGCVCKEFWFGSHCEFNLILVSDTINSDFADNYVETGRINFMGPTVGSPEVHFSVDLFNIIPPSMLTLPDISFALMKSIPDPSVPNHRIPLTPSIDISLDVLSTPAMTPWLPIRDHLWWDIIIFQTSTPNTILATIPITFHPNLDSCSTIPSASSCYGPNTESCVAEKVPQTGQFDPANPHCLCKTGSFGPYCEFTIINKLFGPDDPDHNVANEYPLQTGVPHHISPGHIIHISWDMTWMNNRQYPLDYTLVLYYGTQSQLESTEPKRHRFITNARLGENSRYNLPATTTSSINFIQPYISEVRSSGPGVIYSYHNLHTRPAGSTQPPINSLPPQPCGAPFNLNPAQYRCSLSYQSDALTLPSITAAYSDNTIVVMVGSMSTALQRPPTIFQHTSSTDTYPKLRFLLRDTSSANLHSLAGSQSVSNGSAFSLYSKVTWFDEFYFKTGAQLLLPVDIDTTSFNLNDLRLGFETIIPIPDQYCLGCLTRSPYKDKNDITISGTLQTWCDVNTSCSLTPGATCDDITGRCICPSGYLTSTSGLACVDQTNGPTCQLSCPPRMVPSDNCFECVCPGNDPLCVSLSSCTTLYFNPRGDDHIQLEKISHSLYQRLGRELDVALKLTHIGRDPVLKDTPTPLGPESIHCRPVSGFDDKEVSDPRYVHVCLSINPIIDTFDPTTPSNIDYTALNARFTHIRNTLQGLFTAPLPKYSILPFFDLLPQAPANLPIFSPPSSGTNTVILTTRCLRQIGIGPTELATALNSGPCPAPTDTTSTLFMCDVLNILQPAHSIPRCIGYNSRFIAADWYSTQPDWCQDRYPGYPRATIPTTPRKCAPEMTVSIPTPSAPITKTIDINNQTPPSSTTTPTIVVNTKTTITIQIPHYPNIDQTKPIIVTINYYPETSTDVYSSHPIPIYTAQITPNTETITFTPPNQPLLRPGDRLIPTVTFTPLPDPITGIRPPVTTVITPTVAAVPMCMNPPTDLDFINDQSKWIDSCSAQATCTADNHCTCNPGWTSSVVNSGTCDLAPCSQCDSQHTDTCNPDNTCSCQSGWSGSDCSLSQGCLKESQAKCNYPNGSLTNINPTQCSGACACQNFWVGAHCDKCNLECLNNGRNVRDCSKCGCPSGFSGDRCQCRAAVGGLTINGWNDIVIAWPSIQESTKTLQNKPQVYYESKGYLELIHEDIVGLIAAQMQITPQSITLGISPTKIDDADHTTFTPTILFGCNDFNPQLNNLDDLKTRWSALGQSFPAQEAVQKWFTFPLNLPPKTDQTELDPVPTTVPAESEPNSVPSFQYSILMASIITLVTLFATRFF